MASNQKKVGKVFIDSSVLIAASISPKGSARDLIKKALRQEIQIVVSDLVIEETQRNLANKAPQTLSALQLFLETLNPEVISPTRILIKRVSKIIEIKDVPIVAGAMKSKADYLVSYDRKHLLKKKQEIQENFNIKVITPDELIKK